MFFFIFVYWHCLLHQSLHSSLVLFVFLLLEEFALARTEVLLSVVVAVGREGFAEGIVVVVGDK